MVARKTKKASGRRPVGHKPSPILNVTSASQFGELGKILDKHPLVLVLVYADWCGHCQHFKPEWKNISKTANRNMPMVSVRDDVFPASPLKNLVTPEGFPTVAVVSKPNSMAVNLPSREPTMLTNIVTNADKLTPSPDIVNQATNVATSNNIVTMNNKLSNATLNKLANKPFVDEDIDVNTADVSTNFNSPVTRNIEPPLSEAEYLSEEVAQKGGAGLWASLQGPAVGPLSLFGGKRKRTTYKRKATRKARKAIKAKRTVKSRGIHKRR
jgi:thiol-disulfide isomerase/thioredoxin